MSQRNSEYKRQPRDLYETPEWVTEALIPHIADRALRVWEPAAGNNAMVDVLKYAGFKVLGTDTERGQDFFDYVRYGGCPRYSDDREPDAIVTNPPYGLAQRFVEHSINFVQPAGGIVAMLLPTDFDSAKGRRHLFGDCQIFKRKIVLTRRIVWFKREDGKREAPSTNHCWMIWDWKHCGGAEIVYHYEPPAFLGSPLGEAHQSRRPRAE